MRGSRTPIRGRLRWGCERRAAYFAGGPQDRGAEAGPALPGAVVVPAPLPRILRSQNPDNKNTPLRLLPGRSHFFRLDRPALDR